MAVVSSLCPAHLEVLTDEEGKTHDRGACPGAGVVVVLNATAAKIVLEAARNGLLTSFQHPGFN
eukprot:14771517-Alexandrium_andersonii.AAC.1